MGTHSIETARRLLLAQDIWPDEVRTSPTDAAKWRALEFREFGTLQLASGADCRAIVAAGINTTCDVGHQRRGNGGDRLLVHSYVGSVEEILPTARGYCPASVPVPSAHHHGRIYDNSSGYAMTTHLPDPWLRSP